MAILHLIECDQCHQRAALLAPPEVANLMPEICGNREPPPGWIETYEHTTEPGGDGTERQFCSIACLAAFYQLSLQNNDIPDAFRQF